MNQVFMMSLVCEVICGADSKEASRAITLLYNFYEKPIKKYLAFKSDKYRVDINDIYQETILTLIDKIREKSFIYYSDYQSEAYIKRIAFNKLVTSLRNDNVRMINESKYEEDRFSDDESLDDEEFRSSQSNALQELLTTLDPICMSILQLSFIEKRSTSEICETLGLESIGATKTRKSRCLEKLRKLFKDGFN